MHMQCVPGPFSRRLEEGPGDETISSPYMKSESQTACHNDNSFFCCVTMFAQAVERI